MRAAVAASDSWASVTASIRTKVAMFGEELVGTGSYARSGPGIGPYRLELRLGVGENFGTLREVSDGQFLWIFRETDDSPTLTRVDVGRVKKALDAQSLDEAPNPLPTKWLGLGGLPRLLHAIDQSFVMESITEASVRGRPVVHLTGRWRDAAWRKFAQTADRNPGEFGDHVPTSVHLYLDRHQLFPYGIEFFGSPERSTGGTQRGPERALLSIELFDVSIGGAVDPSQFVYRHGEMAFRDGTNDFLEQNRLPLVPEAEAGAAP